MTRPELRRTERLDTRLTVRCERGGAVCEGTTVNLSLGGALLQITTSPAPAVGEKWQLDIVLPTLDQPLRADAEVRWVGVSGECGVQFATGFRAREAWALGQWLERVRKEAP